MLLQALALAGTALAGGFAPWAAGAILLGIGTAMVYPTLLAAVSDVAHPSWRATAVGVYRLRRDTGFAVGAVLAGLVADLAGLEAWSWPGGCTRPTGRRGSHDGTVAVEGSAAASPASSSRWASTMLWSPIRLSSQVDASPVWLDSWSLRR